MRLPLILKVLLRKFIIRRYYDKDGYPNKCAYCDSTLIGTIVRDRLEHIVCEEEYKCLGCGKTIAYWGYGVFDCRDDWTFTWDWYKWVKENEKNKLLDSSRHTFRT